MGVEIGWNEEEVVQAELISRALDLCVCSHVTDLSGRVLTIESATAPKFTDGLWISPEGNFSARTLLVRHVLAMMGFDESGFHHWRIEHKLVQALLLNRYCPGAVPPTQGFGRLLQPYLKDSAANAHRAICDATEVGFVKPSCGFGLPRTGATVEDVYLHQSEWQRRVSEISDETWLLQERLCIREEYRVHTIEKHVIEALTTLRHGRRAIRQERDGPNEFVRDLLSALPSAFTRQSVFGWDIARLGDGSYKVVELNVTGNHVASAEGFQCSGALNRSDTGSYLIGLFMLSVERLYKLQFDVEASGGPAAITTVYCGVARWLDVLRIVDTIRQLSDAEGLRGLSDGCSPTESEASSTRTLKEVVRYLTRVNDLL